MSFKRRKQVLSFAFTVIRMSTVHDAYDMLEDGDKKPIKNHQAYSKNDRLTIEQERIAKIIDYINVHGEITNREARELLGLADSTTKRFLRQMVAQSLLVV